jgi:hypothetical protein
MGGRAAMIVDAKTRIMEVLRFLRDFDQIRNKPLRHVRQHISYLLKPRVSKRGQIGHDHAHRRASGAGARSTPSPAR